MGPESDGLELVEGLPTPGFSQGTLAGPIYLKLFIWSANQGRRDDFRPPVPILQGPLVQNPVPYELVGRSSTVREARLEK